MDKYHSVGIALVVCIVGLVVFLVSDTKPNRKEVGRIMLFCGLLVALIRAGVAAFLVT